MTTVNKSELAGALAALGKLVCRLSPIQVYRAVQIEANNNTLFFRTRNLTEQIEFRMSTDMDGDIPATLAEFEPFRLAVRNCKNKTLKLEIESGEVFIEGVKLNPVKGDFPELEGIPEQDNVAVTSLPDNFVEMLSAAAPLVDLNEARNILHGMNLSRNGLTATNGKELFNCPYPFKLDELTIPFPLALMATKASGEGRLTVWNNDTYVMFTVRIGQWRWTARALPGAYPNWQRVMPDSKDLKHFVSFTVERAERLRFFLKSVADTKPANEIRLYRDAVGFFTLRDGDEHEFGIPAEFDPTWGNFAIIVKKDILLHLLGKGHTRIEFSDALCPFVGSGGIGQYVAMPMRMPKIEPQPQDATAAQAAPESQETQTSISINSTTNPKESTTMETKITPVVSASNVQTITPNNEPANPLDELTANIEAMKAKLKAMYDESAVMSRKVREVAIAQRQKEREYVQTKRTIERIRTASGF